MGAAVAAPLAVVNTGICDVINEALTARPEEVQIALRPLLDLDLHGLCEAYRLLAQEGTPTVAAADLEQVLGLPPLASKVIIAGRSSMLTLELLTLLVLLSHTHAAVKARFLHSAANRCATGRLNFKEFRAVSVAFLRTACFLAHAPRSQWPKVAIVDVLVTPLFNRFAPQISKDDFVSLLMSMGPLARMLNHFSRGAVDQNFRLAHRDNASPKRPESRSDPGKTIASVLPKRPSSGRYQRTMTPTNSVTSSLYRVLPRRMCQTPDLVSSPTCDLDSDDDQVSSVCSPRSTKSHTFRREVSPTVPRTPPPCRVARRRGYFQAVPSKREVALQDELDKLQKEKAESAKSRDGGFDSIIFQKEADLRKEIQAEIGDEEHRSTYRRCLEDVRNGMLSTPDGIGILPPGCLWSASQEHVACGGSLPLRCIRPLTPEKVQQHIHNHDLGVHRFNGNGRDHSQMQQPKTLEQLLSNTAGVIFGSQASSTRPGSSKPKRLDSNENVSAKGSNSSVSDVNTSRFGSRWHRLGNPTTGDVLTAFELYRASYWRRDGEKTSHRYQRDADIVAILTEARRETHTWQDCTISVRTLRNFFQSIWPNLSSYDFKMMLQMIERSRTAETVSAPVSVESPQRTAETLRELVELFDAIDTNGCGAVPLEAVEQFLCGELLTARETEQLTSQREQFGSALIGVPAGCEAYIDIIRDHSRGRFMTTQVEDRDEWSVTVAENDRRWQGLRLQARLSVKAVQHASQHEQPSFVNPEATAKARSAALCRIIGQRMDKLATFFDGKEEDAAARGASTCDATDDFLSGSHIEIPNGDLEVACKPGLIPPAFKAVSSVAIASRLSTGTEQSARPRGRSSLLMTAMSTGGSNLETNEVEQPPGQLRLVRLYWRYLLGSAVQQQLRDCEQTSFLNLQGDGQIDLVGFICILAHDQLRGLFPKGATPTATVIRETAYAK